MQHRSTYVQYCQRFTTTKMYDLDCWLLLFINRGCSWHVLDVTMPIVTALRWWLPVFAIGMGWLLIGDGRRGRYCAVLIAMTVVAADLVTNRVIKPIVSRERPCSALEHEVVMRIPCPAGPSFPSSHAVNMAAIAVVLTQMYRRWWWLWWMGAVVVGFSRVYVGVHYPGDVLVGWLWGSCVGAGMYWSADWVRKHKPLLCKRSGLIRGG